MGTKEVREMQTDKIVDVLKGYIKNYSGYFNANEYYDICKMLAEISPQDSKSGVFDGTVYKKIKSNLQDALKNNGLPLSFVLGAGVSVDFGIPNWEELIYRMNFSGYWEKSHCGTKNINCRFDDDMRKKLKPLFRSQNNLYEWAQYAENNFNSEIVAKSKWLGVPSDVQERDLDNKIYSVVSQSLFYDVRKDTKIYDKITKGKTRFDGDIEGCTLFFIGEIIKKYSMDRVITYNYDDCLEYVYEKHFGDCLPIFDKEQLQRPKDKNLTVQILEEQASNVCEIYHVHGFIPYFSEFKEGGSKYGRIERDFDSWDGRKVILTEVSYDEMRDEIYRWRNAVQVDAFLRHSCFFVGFSATDINFRRIVKQLSKRMDKDSDSSRTHFIAICLDDYFEQIRQADIREITDNEYYDVESVVADLISPKFADKLFPYISSIIFMLLDRKRYLESYKIAPLFTTRKDLPFLLKEL